MRTFGFRFLHTDDCGGGGNTVTKMIQTHTKVFTEKGRKKFPYSCSKRETFAWLESTAFLPTLSPNPCQSCDLEQETANRDVGGEAARVLLTTGKCLSHFSFIALNSPLIRGARKESKKPKAHMTTPNPLSYPGCKKMGQVVRT